MIQRMILFGVFSGFMWLWAASSNKKPIQKKSTPPVRFWVSQSGVFPTQQKVNVTVKVTPLVPCSNLTVHVYGVDGVQIEGSFPQNFTACTTQTSNATVFLPPKTNGLIVLQAHFTDAQGRKQSAVQSFAAQTADAPAKKSQVGQKSNTGKYTILPTQ